MGNDRHGCEIIAEKVDVPRAARSRPGLSPPSWSTATTRFRSEKNGASLGPGGETRRVHSQAKALGDGIHDRRMNSFPLRARRVGADRVIVFRREDCYAFRLAERHRGEVEGRGKRQDPSIGNQG
jgi:hypothetical protein